MRDVSAEETRQGDEADALLIKGEEAKPQVTPINGFSSGALVCSIGGVVSTLIMHPGLGGLLAALSIVLGAVGLTKPDGRGMAAAGLAISVLHLLLLGFVVLGVLGFLGLGR